MGCQYLSSPIFRILCVGGDLLIGTVATTTPNPSSSLYSSNTTSTILNGSTVSLDMTGTTTTVAFVQSNTGTVCFNVTFTAATVALAIVDTGTVLFDVTLTPAVVALLGFGSPGSFTGRGFVSWLETVETSSSLETAIVS